MHRVQFRPISPLRRSYVRLTWCLVACLAPPATAKPEAEVGDDVTKLPAFNVTGERLEDFGFRVSPDFDVQRSTKYKRVYTPVVDVVLPNTAASKAGLRPGDRILTADGESTAAGSMSPSRWRDLQGNKWRAVSAGHSAVDWTLQVETAGTWEMRTVKLQLPTPPPHWGSTVWRAPAGRVPVTLDETGPLTERAQDILNHGIWMILRASYVRGFDLPTDARHPHFLAYQWTLWSGEVGHRMYVSRQRGRTDIILEAIFRESGPGFSFTKPAVKSEQNLTSATTQHAIDSVAYLTSPSARLEKAWRLPPSNQQHEVPADAAQAGFQVEVEFWTTRVGKVSPLWPLGVIEPAAQKKPGTK